MLKFLESDLMLRVQELYLHFLNGEDKKNVRKNVSVCCFSLLFEFLIPLTEFWDSLLLVIRHLLKVWYQASNILNQEFAVEALICYLVCYLKEINGTLSVMPKPDFFK